MAKRADHPSLPIIADARTPFFSIALIDAAIYQKAQSKNQIAERRRC